MSLKYIIINADDAGLSTETDAGILETIRSGIVTSVSLLVNPPFQADLDSFRESGVSIGLHLNLTHGYPCALLSLSAGKKPGNPSLPSFPKERADETGGFNPEEVKTEFMSQLYRFIELTGKNPTHLDVHKHLHYRSTGVFPVVMEMARELHVPMRCLDGAMRTACRAAGIRSADHFAGNVSPAPYWTMERLKEELSYIPDGITEIMCHPGKGMKPQDGITYVAERDQERKTFASLEAKGLLEPFRLVDFRTAPFR
ncbi:MAG: hypothetical protein C0392_04600 [Syntrophus sp. (in: bacteria)]|nr:hypothetical protein [Syntrophus sp. (in: bacteria)]